MNSSHHQDPFPFDFPVEEYDKFAKYSPTSNENIVFVPVHIYELFKGISIDRINLVSSKTLKINDLTL